MVVYAELFIEQYEEHGICGLRIWSEMLLKC